MNKKWMGVFLFLFCFFFVGTIDAKAVECSYNLDPERVLRVTKTAKGADPKVYIGTKTESIDIKDFDANLFFKANNTFTCPSIYWVREKKAWYSSTKNYVSTSKKEGYSEVSPNVKDPEGENGTVTNKVCTYERTLNTGYTSSSEDISAKRRVVLRFDSDEIIRVEVSGTNFNNPPGLEGDFNILSGEDTCSWWNPENCTFKGYLEDTSSYADIEGCPRMCIDVETKEYFFIPLDGEVCTDRRGAQTMNEDEGNDTTPEGQCKELTDANKNSIQDKLNNIEYDSGTLESMIATYDYKYYNPAEINSFRTKSSEILTSLENMNRELEKICDSAGDQVVKEFQNQIRYFTNKITQNLKDLTEILKKSHEYFKKSGDTDTAKKIEDLLKELGETSSSIDQEVKRASLLSKLEFGNKIEEATCESILGDLVDELQKYFDWIKILAPILLIIFGGLDFSKAVITSDKDALKKATNSFVKRCIAALAIFFLPTLIQLLFSMTDLSIADAVCGIL